MGVITNLRVPLSIEDVTHAWGARRGKLASPRMLALVAELLERAETENWLQPAVSFQVWPIVEHGPGWMELSNGSRLKARLLSHYLRGASHLALGICTVGAAVENRVSEWFAASERLRAVVLDDIGSLALYRLSDQIEALLQKEAEARGLEASGVLSPGEDGFELTEQAKVAELAGGKSIGISITSTGMMIPRKSLSMVMGFGAQMPKWGRGERCARCGARERCPHRQQVLVGAPV
ncbi:MAG TPA: hypothetical protein VN822_01550 [Candidatus Acidoferrales bacterium]|nr:hypothetical protein [Candidatus Acidoferrales bacterium]